MTGLECLREEMKRRGASDVMIKSASAAMVLDIVAHTNNQIYRQTKEAEDKLEQLNRAVEYARENKRRAEEEYNHVEKDLLDIRAKIQNGKSQLNARQQRELADAQAYIQDFNDSLKNCETPDGRDRMRTAQMFVDTVDVHTKYDNTAFIIGLAAILTQGKVNAIGELKKMNKKIIVPSELPEWLERPDDDIEELDY